MLELLSYRDKQARGGGWGCGGEREAAARLREGAVLSGGLGVVVRCGWQGRSPAPVGHRRGWGLPPARQRWEATLAPAALDPPARLPTYLPPPPIHPARQIKRKPEVLDALKFIHSTAWPALWGKAADDLQQANAADDEYMIADHDLAVGFCGFSEVFWGLCQVSRGFGEPPGRPDRLDP
jgi:hypothetical protein